MPPMALAQSFSISNGSYPPIQGATDAAEKLQLSDSLVRNRRLVLAYSKTLAAQVPQCLWAQPFVGQITQLQRESALSKVENVADEELMNIVSKLPSLPKFHEKMRRDIAFQNSKSTLLRANELLEDVEASKFVLNWLERFTTTLAPGCRIPEEYGQTALAYDLTRWALSK